MKSLLSAITAAAVAVAAHAGTVVHSVTFDASGWTTGTAVVDGTQYATVGYNGIDACGEPGTPGLPVKHVRLLVPFNATNITVTATHGAASTETLTNKVLPMEEPQIADESAGVPVIREDSLVYSTDSAYPCALAEIVSDGFFMGENHIITVALHPVQYNPVSGQLTRYSSVTATVHYDTGSADGLLLSRNAAARSKDHSMLATLVDNPTSIEAFSPSMAGPSFAPGTGSQSPLEHYEYTVITTRALAPAYKRLIALKRQKGYSAGVVCVEDLMNNPLINGGDSVWRTNGVLTVIPDSAGVIRQYLRRVHPLGTRFVLMGARSIPFRYGYRSDRHTGNDTISKNVPTDWYYSDLNTNWNTNNNRFYGEVGKYGSRNPFDIFPELYVGRLMAENESDIHNYTQKLMRYELNPGNGNTNYLKNALVVKGADDFDTCHAIAQTYNEIGMNVNMILQNNGKDYPTGSFVISQMKNSGIHSIHGHGSPYTVSVNNHKTTGDKTKTNRCIASLTELDTKDADGNNGFELMNNKYCPGVSYSWSCTNMPFDNYYNAYLDKLYTHWNLAQSYTMGENYGGVAYFGDTRDGYRDFDKMEKQFIKSLEEYPNAGIAEANSKNNEYSHPQYFAMVHNLIGDPEFFVWTDLPHQFNNVHVTRRDNGITVTGANENTIVSCSGNTKIDRYRITGDPFVKDGVDPNGTIIIYAHNYMPYRLPLVLQNCDITNSQYVIANNFSAGNLVDNNRTPGNVTVKTNVNYVVETSTEAKFDPGFSVEKGASLHVFVSDEPIY